MSADDYKLSPDRLRRMCSVDHFTFETTEDLPLVRDIIGQPRGVHAIEFGIDIESRGYNIYVLGPTGTGRTTAIQKFLEQRAKEGEVPMDWAYVHNFETPHKPRALDLPPGMGNTLKEAMEGFLEDLQLEIPRALDTEEFQEAMDSIGHNLQQQREDIMNALQGKAKEKELSIIRTSSGLMVVPTSEDGQPLAPEAFAQLPEKTRQTIEMNRHDIEHQLEEALREVRQLEKEAKEAAQKLEKEAVAGVLDLQMAELREACSGHEETMFWLGQVREDVLDNVNDFKAGDEVEEPPQANLPPGMTRPRVPDDQKFRRYKVNLIVDHSATEGAPVVVVELPSYQNLIGQIESEVRFGGAMSTDFTMIKSGALHQANGGYLVVRATDILTQPFAWEGLKRALNVGHVHIEEPVSRTGTGVLTPQAPEPEPIPLKVKVVMLGSPKIYYLLHGAEEDFPELFKVKADFAATMERSHDTENDYGLFVAARCNEEGLPHFDRTGIAKVVEYSSWLADDQSKLSARFGDIADLVHEAAYWSRREGKEIVSGADVERAIHERVYRANLVEERIQERILEGAIFIDTDGAVVGQVNGVSVLNLGDYAFGQPSRVTARVFLGTRGVVNVEREVEMAGPIHNKGLMILRGYLGGQYATDHPLSLTASLTFEQNYGGIEGDSASSTELYALLSSLSNYPVRQDTAVTGSVNQLGQVQPIGGATQKIEGFYEVCKARGLTGSQGVMIPASNVSNLMLREEVVQAVQEGGFHIYAVETIDQGIEVLTGVDPGERGPDGTFPEETVHHAVQSRLREMAEELERFTGFRRHNG
jgi:predicted ATP-dependent protease